MNYYSYKIEHDYGLAPNPFHNYCTLAVCKSRIRRNKKLQIGDWIFGTGSKKMNNENRIILAMCVTEKITFDEYWNDNRFAAKKPLINGSLVQIYGDNFYHTDDNGNVIQENSAHSIDNNTSNEDHKKRDIGGKYVLISSKFYYFGNQAPLIPSELLDICDGRDFKYVNKGIALNFIDWLKNNYDTGIHGDPCSWNVHLKK